MKTYAPSSHHRLKMLVPILIVFFAVLRVNAAPQDIDLTANLPLHVFNLTLGVPVNSNIGVLNAAENIFWQFDSAPGTPITDADGFQTGFTIAGITVSLPAGASETVAVGSGEAATVSGTPTAAGTHSFTITIAGQTTSTTRTRQYQLQILRQPIDLALVLDRSGSMGWGYDGGGSPPPGQRRWDGLAIGVGVVQTQLGMTTLNPADMLGIRMFAGSLVTPPAPFNSNLVNMQTNAPSLGVIEPLTPSGGTALGAGILAARDMLLPGTSGSNKAIIVFSDGEQNSGDQVQVAGPNAHTHTVSNQKLSGPANEIRIHTISLGSMGYNPLLMQNIASANGGQYLNTTAGSEDDFTFFFNTHLINILSGSSPQYVDVRRAAFPVPPPDQRSTSEQSFSVNSGVRSLNVTLIASNNLEPHFISFSKDGTELIQFARQTSGSGFRSIGIDSIGPGAPISALDGDWKVVAGVGTVPKSQIPYILLVVVDDHNLIPEYSLGTDAFKLNDELAPSVTLRHGGTTLEGAQVQAVVVKPGDDLNDLLARAEVDFTQDPNDPGSPGVAKLAALMQDSTFLEKIKATDQLVNLAFDSSGDAYTGTFSGMDLTGVYQVLYRLSLDHAELGKIRRFHQRSFYVRFEDIDLDDSQMSISQNQQGNTVINFRPITSGGRYLGPGWGPVISLDAPQASISEVVDHADGSYDVVVSGPLSGSGTLSIADEPVFKGNFDNLECYGPNAGLIKRIQCWLMRLGLPGWMLWIILLILLLLIVFLIRR